MEYRELGRTGWRISSVGVGAWAIGDDAWGRTDGAMARVHDVYDRYARAEVHGRW